MERYQDYVIKDGKFIGKFEEMYQKFDDPWHQKEIFHEFYSKSFTSETLKQYGIKKVLEIGCGLGAFTDYLHSRAPGCCITGMDISKTAVEKAKRTYPDIDFLQGDILTFSRNPDSEYDAIIFSEIMWYILEDLDEVIRNLSENYGGGQKLVIVNQVFYKGEQKYGNEFFTCLDEMVEYLPWKCLRKISIDRMDDGFCESHSVFRI